MRRLIAAAALWGCQLLSASAALVLTGVAIGQLLYQPNESHDPHAFWATLAAAAALHALGWWAGYRSRRMVLEVTGFK